MSVISKIWEEECTPNLVDAKERDGKREMMHDCLVENICKRYKFKLSESHFTNFCLHFSHLTRIQL